MSMRAQTCFQAAALSLCALVAACSGGSGEIGGGTGTTGTTTGSTTGTTTGTTTGGTTTGTTTGGTTTGGTTGGGTSVASVTLLSSSPQLASSASSAANGVTLSAIVKDASNNLVSGATVAFASSAGALQVTQATTDASGTATAILTTGGDPTNRTITVAATTGGQQGTVQVAEAGTTLTISGTGVVGSGTTQSYVVTLANSSSSGIANQTITLKSALNNAISPASATTNASGQVTFSYTGTNGGTDTLTATGLGLTSTSSVSVSSSTLNFQNPAAGTNVPFNTVQPVSVKYIQNGAAVANQVITFTATRGTFNGATATSATAVTDASGVASVNLQTDGSTGAGGVIVSAQAGNGGPSSSLSLQFVATTPASVSVQADPATISPSGTSKITSIVRDANNNLVAGAQVNFTLSDSTGGTLSAGFGTTDQQGTTSITYQASSTTSATDGVRVSAAVSGTSVSSTVPAKITVAGKALSVVLGTGNTVSKPTGNDTVYQLPYAVKVTDSAGNPAPSNTSISLSIVSVAYQKGSLAFNGTFWAPNSNAIVPASDPDYKSNFGCANEDVNANGTLDPGEDYNGSTRLEPGNVASVPSTVALDPSTGGTGQFFVTYPRDHASWVLVTLRAIASVSGSEATQTASFVLPGAAEDYNSASVTPPGQVSPYGVSKSCANPN